METPDVIICGKGHAELIPGTKPVNCSDCGTDLVIAPSGQRLIAERPEVLPVCQPCGMKRAREAVDEGEDVEFHSAPGSRAELFEHTDITKEDWRRIKSLFGITEGGD